MLDEILSEKLSQIKDAGLLRRLRLIASAPAANITIDGKEYINFSSNNYLDLSGNGEINKSAAEAAEKYGFGGASSRLVGGNLPIHAQLETALAAFKNKRSSLVLASGYQTNAGILSALGSIENACVIMDKLNHASLWDGAKLSGARVFVYEHCNMDSFESVLKRARGYKLKIAVTESVFSMDGDFAPLADFAALCRKHDAVSMVDEAHSTGVFGKEGRGLAEEANVSDKIDITIGTLSKAFGAQGGFVCGSRSLIDYLTNKSRAFIYTTAISPAIAGAVLKALEIIKKSDAQRALLLDNAKYLREKLNEAGLKTGGSRSQIIPVITGSLEETEKLSKYLFENFVFAPAIKPPTVPEGQARIRISLTAGHDKDSIEKFLQIIKSYRV
ncbi:MAG: 8-amino-7-oxononanoate synthase [Endomicrobium sp.]|jgi:8-amino-7-oxononanoate synthase|nr:8-amino-7-oxononanoate synthase [Endomicrobium sp.]